MRLAAKRDIAEPAIVQALEGVGCKVVKLSDPDLPDLLVADYRGTLRLIECKTGKAKLRPGQERFRDDMAKHGVKVHVVTSPEEALDAIEFTWRRA